VKEVLLTVLYRQPLLVAILALVDQVNRVVLTVRQ
jgi:hypothetical protein